MQIEQSLNIQQKNQPQGPRQRLPNENPKDYMLSTYTSLELVFEINAATSIFRIDPFTKYLCAWLTEASTDEMPAIKSRTLWRHPNIVSFIFFDEPLQQSMEFNKRSIRIFYEYLALDIKQLLEKRAQTQSHIPEAEVWKFIQGLSSAFLFLQKKGINHGGLQMETVYFDEEYLLYRVQDISPFRAKAPGLFKNAYWAPELLNQGQIKLNKFKIDVFSFGIITLNMLILRDCANIFQSNVINKKMLDECLKEVGQLYGHQIKTFVESILDFNPETRPDWQELQLKIDAIQQQQVLKQKSENKQLSETKETVTKGDVPVPKNQEDKSDKKKQNIVQNYCLDLKEKRRNTETRVKGGLSSNLSSMKLDEKLQMLNAKIQETLNKSQNKYIR